MGCLFHYGQDLRRNAVDVGKGIKEYKYFADPPTKELIPLSVIKNKKNNYLNNN